MLGVVRFWFLPETLPYRVRHNQRKAKPNDAACGQGYRSSSPTGYRPRKKASERYDAAEDQ